MKLEKLETARNRKSKQNKNKDNFLHIYMGIDKKFYIKFKCFLMY